MSAEQPEDLLEERDFLIRSLDDLEREHDAGDLTDEDYARLRDHYTRRTALVLRQLEGAGPAQDAGSLEDPDAVWSERRSRRRPLLVGLAMLLAAALAGWGVAASFGQRLPGEQATGSIELTSADELVRARNLMADGRAVEAIKAFDGVLRDDPRHPEALAYRGWLLRLAGLSDEGLTYIERAIEADPTYADARFFRGMILFEDRDDPAAAVVELRAFLAADPPPEMVSLVEGVLARAEAAAASQGSTTTAP